MKRSRIAALASALMAGAFIAAPAFAGGKTCPFTGEPIEAGAPSVAFNGTNIEFCCKRCVRKFEGMSDTEKTAVLAKLSPAAKDKKADDHHAEHTGAATPAGNLVCPVSGKEVPADARTVTFKGVAVALCCPGCETKWAAMDDDAKFDFLLAHADMGPVNDTCPIGKEPIDLATKTNRILGKSVGYCCPGCDKTFAKKSPEDQKAFLAKYDNLEIANTWCPVGKHEINADGGTVVFNGKKVQFCCPDCIPGWIKMTNPERQSALDAAIAAGKAHGSAH